MFHLQYALLEAVCVIFRKNRYSALADYRAGVRSAVYQMHGRASDSYAVVERLSLAIEPGKGGEQCRVDVEYALWV